MQNNEKAGEDAVRLQVDLRDYFAGQALAGFIVVSDPDSSPKPINAARWAYEYADAMLAERVKDERAKPTEEA